MRSRERACTCLHRVWCSQSRICLLSRQCGTSFLACGALCSVAAAEGHRLPLYTSRLHSLHTREEVGEVEEV